MRKIYFLFFILFSCFIVNQNVNAQLANSYIYTASTGATLDPMTGATTIVNSSVDDTPSALQNIGFTFTYETIAYTQFSASPDGFIKLGTPAASAQFGNDIVSTTNIPKLFPYWDDLATGTTGWVKYVVTGSAPNRILVVEWFITAPRNTTGAPNSTFQAWLYETSGKIEFRYGTVVGPTGSASIGINGATSTNYISITTPANTASTTTPNNLNTALPPSGTMFTFLPPPPCVAPPGGGTTQSTTTVACPGVPFTLSVTGASFGTGLTYQWDSSYNGTTWNPVAGATGQTLNISITGDTWFRRRITCTGVDGFSTALQVQLAPPIATPFTENFSTYLTSFPPGCWTRNNATYIFGQAPSAYGLGSGSAKFDFFNAANGTNLDLVTPLFAAVPANYRVTFDHAYATYTGQVDQLQVFYSTDGGTTYTSLATYLGGAAGPLNTFGGTGATTANFAPTAAQWATKAITLPVGTNKIRFRGVSAFGNNMFLDNIVVEPIPPCLPPSGLTITSATPTTAALSWTASASNPSNGYQWEVRTSGAAGSGATGLAASGTTLAGVTTATATGLTPNTNYTYYVRGDCSAGVFSNWTGGFDFATPCNPITTPFTEAFTTYATTFPPMCWTRNNTSFVLGNAVSAYGAGTGSAKFDFYNANAGTNLDLVSPLFTPVPTGWRLTFDHAYATFLGEVDELRIFYSTDGGATYLPLISYAGGLGGPLTTGGSSIPAFTPSASQWLDKAVDLPVGTNRLLFRGVSAFGNNLYLDNIVVEQTPSCLPVTNLSAVGVSPTSIIVSFNSPAPGTSFVVEYGPSGFIPGTTNLPGGGTVAFGGPSPITLSLLTPNTNYDIYVRQMCIAGVDFSINKKTNASTLCNATNIPYLQDFESSVAPAPPTCTSIQDVNGNSGSVPNSGGGGWFTYDGGANTQTYVSPTKTIRYLYDASNPARPADDWFYTQGLNLTGGTSYRLKFFIKGSDGPTWIERLEVKYGTVAHSSGMSNLLYTNNAISSNLASPWDSVIVDFTPATTSVYYIGFHAISLADQAFLYLDNVSVKIAPKVDVGITGITTPSLNCPTNGVFLQATIRNYNTTTVNFATFPVTVTANITGAATATLSTVLNAGTLAPGASMGIYLSPAFNFTGGLYNITVATSSPDDPETGNDAYTTSITVNPNPPTPVITPATAQICLGSQTQLSTQFTNPPPPPVTLPAVTTGTISIPIPDANLAGISSTLVVNGVPGNATVTGISVTLNATHTWNSDLIFNLKAPNGKVLNLVNQRGGNGDNFTNCIISSASTTQLPAGNTTPVTGTFAADGAMGVGPTAFVSNVPNFAGLYSVGNGSWVLAVNDNALFDVGTLTGWSITITYQVLNPTVTWTPITGLYTNSGATTAYTAGTDAYSVYVKPAAVGTYNYTVTATSSAGCTSTGSATVTVNPIPVLTVGSIPDTVCLSDPQIPLVATPVGGSWSGIGVSGTDFIPPATAVGTYTLTYSYTSPQGCPNTITKKIAVKECPERIILLRDNAVILYPNPNNGNFNIRINSVLYSYLTMKVYTNAGVLVRTQQFGGLAWGRVIPVDLTNLPGGVYMVQFYYEGGVRTSQKTFKVIIAR